LRAVFLWGLGVSEFSLLLVVDATGSVLLAEGADQARFAVEGAVGRSVADVCAHWPALLDGMERARAGLAGRATVEAGGVRFDVRFQPRRRADGSSAGALLTAESIGDRASYDALARSEERLAEAQRLAHVGSWEWEVGADVVHWTDEMYRIYGLEPGAVAITYQSFLERVLPEDRAHTEAVVRAALQQGEPFVYDHRIVRSDGAIRVLHTRGGVVKNEDGAPTRLGGACWDVTERWQSNQDRDRAMSLLRATLEATADGLLVVDRSGHIAAYNQRLLELWQIPPGMLDQVDFEKLLGLVDPQLEPESAAACLRRVRALQADLKGESFDALVFRDGRFFERYSRPQRIDHEIVGRVWSYRDVTERERLLRDVQRALAVRDEFLSVVTHEVRGPIASLHLATQGLRRGVPHDAAEKLLDVIEREGRRVARLTDELVDLARIRSGQISFVFEPVELVDVVREAAARAAPDAARSGSLVTVVAVTPALGRWDRVRLDQIVTKLLSNAIKFGRGRPVELQIESDARWARLVVRDQGIGIDEAERSKLFAPFERAVMPRHYGGLGLGLYIVRRLVEGMGGSVRLESQPDVGTTVTVELPLAKASA
jgi:PAS domain S-box-containing protein